MRALVFLCAITVLGPLPAHADASDGDAAYASAVAAERELRFADAVESYRASLASGVSGRRRELASRRIVLLQARSAHQFADLVALERFRRVPAATAAESHLRNFELALPGFAAGPVRDEAELALASAYVASNRPNRAIPILEAALARNRVDDDHGRAVRSLLSRSYEAVGRTLDASQVLDGSLLANTSRGVRAKSAARAERARPFVAIGYALALVALLVPAARRLSAARAWRSVKRSARVAAAVAIPPCVIAWSFDAEAGPTFVLLGALVTCVLVASELSADSRRADDRVSRRVSVIIACAAAVAAGYLVLEPGGAVISFTP